MEPNDNNLYPGADYQVQAVPSESLGRYTAKTFLWMFLGLLVTFGVALLSYGTLLYYYIGQIPYSFVLLFVVEMAVVIILSGRIHKMSIGAARGLFLFYSAINGIVFSYYFAVFQVGSLVLVFGVTAFYFGGMALFGYCTKVDLSRLRNILFAGLIFLIIFGVLSMFIPAFGMFERIACLIGIVIFLAYTAYDTQKIKAFYQAYQGDEVMLKKASIFSALELYLDFINLFVYLLRILGKRK